MYMSKKTINNRRKTNNRKKTNSRRKTLKKFGGTPENVTNLDDLEHSKTFAKKWVVYEKGENKIIAELTNAEEVKKYLNTNYDIVTYA